MARSRRLRREARTVELMIGMHCHARHSGSTAPGSALCPDCAALVHYARERVDACRFGVAKPTCAHCTVHCFRPTMRERIRAAMRHSGPRMIYRHPYLAVCHLFDRRRVPDPRTADPTRGPD